MEKVRGSRHLMLFSLAVFVLSALVFILFQSLSVFGGDGGDLVSTICVGGVPHPQGYPLYTILGRLAYQLPFFTPAWRVSLLSSLPAAGVVTLVFYLIWRLTKSKLAGSIGAFSLAFSYLFWLYASVPELFSLNNLFLMILLVLTVSIIEQEGHDITSKFYLFSFVAGLSVSHHYFSLWSLLILSFFIYWYRRSYWQEKVGTKIFKCLVLFILGWLPYFYIPLAARTYPVISWENAVNLKNFWNLLSRANYGGFVTQSIALSSGLEQRVDLFLGGLKLTQQFFGWSGIALLIIGFAFLFEQKKRFFWFFLSLFFGSLFALSYTGFYLTQEDIFGLGIYSRFALPEMVLASILIGLGSFWLARKLARLLSFKIFPLLILLTLLLMPASLFIKNSSKIWALRKDFTAENFARDILATVDHGGILLLEEDTSIFNTWYVRYCLNERPDVKVMPVYPFKLAILKKNFPDLVLPETEEDLKEKILKLNSQKFAVYGNSPGFFATGSAIPVGLLWRYFPPGTKVFLPDEILKTSKMNWDKYHDPLSGILRWFRPVTLADVLRSYHGAAKQMGIWLFNGNQLSGAEEFFRKALKYDSKDEEAYLLLGQVLSAEKKCREAESEFKIATLLDSRLADPYFYLAENARQCFKDKEKEENFKKIYEEKKSAREQKLEELGR